MDIRMNEFRVHHILCTPLYEGKGYSGAFCENMTQIVEKLRAFPSQPVFLVSHPDMICKNCPNLTPEGRCRQDKDHVVAKDEALREVLQLEKEKTYTYQELLKRAKSRITKQEFEKTCQNCKWYQMGICTYEKLQEGLENSLAGAKMAADECGME